MARALTVWARGLERLWSPALVSLVYNRSVLLELQLCELTHYIKEHLI